MVDVCKSQTVQAAITPGISGLIALGFQFLTRFAAVFAEEAGNACHVDGDLQDFSLRGGCRGENNFSGGTLLDLVDLTRLDGAMFPGAPVGGLDQGHGLEIVAPADGRFSAGLECDEELGHGADEGVREPALVPSR